ncbi:MAG TPA: hypothetical protein VG722_13320, partial [Tepidisphaeraceae bacterium]|nr:hypothetical protein [Tepidisphaeraceae bacterium]
SKMGSAKACYAVWDRGIVLRAIDYDIHRTLGKIGCMPIPAAVKEDLKSVLCSGGLAKNL